ncbi:MAG TPA: HdeD family acid-resistance protein [Terriglobales bacterium]|nr:HdeD family acid-resistance protein [Terriglobales bacterium]
MDATDQSWLQQAKKNAGWLVFLGIVEIVAGVLGILAPFVAGVAVTVMVGFMLMVAGGARVVGAFKAQSFGAGALTFMWGLLLLVTGFYFVVRPGIGLESLTLVVMIVLFVDGILRVILAFHMKPVKGWGWMLVGGILSILFAVMIWRQFPASSLWVVGTLAGFSMISNGFTTVSVASAARKVATVAAAA